MNQANKLYQYYRDNLFHELSCGLKSINLRDQSTLDASHIINIESWNQFIYYFKTKMWYLIVDDFLHSSETNLKRT